VTIGSALEGHDPPEAGIVSTEATAAYVEEFLPEDEASRMASREPGPAQTFDDTHFDDDVQKALDALPPDFRAAVVLCDIEGLSYEEIAATLGVKLGTVRSRIHRGRAQLRAALDHRRPRHLGCPAATLCTPS